MMDAQDGRQKGPDWELRYQAGDTPWDKGQAAPPLEELIGQRGSGLWGCGPVLVPGCGTGHDVRVIAAAGVEVLGLDIAPTAVEAARRHAVVGREEYRVADFLDEGWPGGLSFSAMWEHTCFCAIPPQRRKDYAASAGRSVSPGGLLAGVFFLDPWDPGEVAEGPPHGVTVEELEECFAPWFELLEGWVPKRTYPGREGKEWIGLFRRLPLETVI